MVEFGNCVSMAAPTKDMAAEDFYLNLSPLPSPRWSPQRLTPSPPRPFLPSSNSNYSMVIQYQGSNQSMDDPPQNQEHDDIVDPAPYLARDSASDWRPSGGGIMTMNNQGFEESNMGFEESMEMTTCFSFPPSPTNFRLYRPMPSVFFVSSEPENKSLALSYRHILEDKTGALHVLNYEEGEDIIDLLFDAFTSYVDNKFGDFDQIAIEAGVVPKFMDSLLDDIDDADYGGRKVTLRRINRFEQDDVDIVDQPVYEYVVVADQLIQNRGGELDVILGGGVFTVNGLEQRVGQGTPTTPEPLLILQAKVSIRVWLTHDGHWVAEVRFRCSRLNNGWFTTVEDAISVYEFVARWSGWKDLTGFAGLFENENRSNMPLQLPLPAQELNPVEDFGLVCCNGTRNDEIESVGTGSEETEDCILADQARLNSGCLGKRKTMEKNTGGERRSKKTNGVRIAIPLEDILQNKGMRLKDAANHLGVSQSSLKDDCREYGIPRWSPSKLITQSHPTETPTLVDQGGIPQSNSDTLPSDQGLAATVEKITNVVVKEILPPPFLPTARQESLNEDFGNFEVEAVGIGSGGTGQSEMEEGQLNSRHLRKEERKEMTPRGEKRNKKTSGVRIAISLEEILQTKEMPLKDAATLLKVSQSSLKDVCREYGIPRLPPHKLITQSHPTETPTLVDQGGISQLNYDTLPSDQPLEATVDTNSGVVRKIHPPQFLPKAQQENPDEDFDNYEVEVVGMGVEGTREGEMEEDEDFGNYEVEAVGMGVEGMGEGEMEEGQLNFGCLGKGKSDIETPRGDRGNKKTNGVKIDISLEDILQAERMYLEETGKQMTLDNAAKKFKVSRSTLKRVCRKYGILSWPPSKVNENISQSCPKEFPAVVDHQEEVQQLNCDILPSNQAWTANVDTNSIVIKARWVDDITVKIRLPKPWKMAELEQQVKKRLKLESGTYYIRYKDEENELITILCDEDLQEYISSSRPLDTNSIEVFLVPK